MDKKLNNENIIAMMQSFSNSLDDLGRKMDIISKNQSKKSALKIGQQGAGQSEIEIKDSINKLKLALDSSSKSLLKISEMSADIKRINLIVNKLVDKETVSNKYNKTAFIDIGNLTPVRFFLSLMVLTFVIVFVNNFTTIYSTLSGLQKERDDYYMYYRLNEVWTYEDGNTKILKNIHDIIGAIKEGDEQLIKEFNEKNALYEKQLKIKELQKEINDSKN